MSAIIIIKEGETKTLQKTTEPNSYERTIIMLNVKVKIYDGIKYEKCSEYKRNKPSGSGRDFRRKSEVHYEH